MNTHEITVSTYVTEAKELLQAMKVKFSANFVGYKQHFSTDNNYRDVFNVTFSREDWTIKDGTTKRFSLKFGQSINDSTGGGKNKPTEYDVLSCLQKYDVGSFDYFCGEFGYDTDSRTAEKTYKAVCKEYEKVSNFFTSEELEKLQETQ